MTNNLLNVTLPDIMTNCHDFECKNVSSEYIPLISHHVFEVFIIINYSILGTVVGLIGMVANVINCAVFVTMGFDETINISLLGLAVSDFFCLLTAEWLYLCFNPYFRGANLPFDSFEVQYLTSGWPHVCFTKVTALITAYITFERCFCVTFPLRVKLVLTPKVVVAVVVSIFVMCLCSMIPAYTVQKLGLKFDPIRNKSIVGLILLDNRDVVESASLLLNNAFGYFAFLINIISAGVLIRNVKAKSKWRQAATTAKNQTTAAPSVKDRKVVKMVILIATLFILSFTPITFIFMGTAIFPEFNYVGKEQNLYNVLASFTLVLETINSSSNIIIYYNMSSKFRSTFCRLFNIREKVI